ncbi:hypothetical protein [Flocculibacter collagenilyticus]|uniref:hypothetical protein n=1 Tax=Flocculibacter collagenilyticus TaxID=2744479 RepID=UPI0018F5C154|nr:hypothetical protein [Flocculibacter collagenilyticus]
MSRAMWVIVLSCLVFSNQSFAGTIDIGADAGKRVAIGATYSDGSHFLLIAKERNGGVRVTIPDQENVTDSIVMTTFQGRVFSFKLSLLGIGAGGLTSIEPFSVPGLASTDDSQFIIAQFNMSEYLSNGINFNIGDTFSVNNGQVSGTPFLDIYDASALSFDPDVTASSLLDSSFISSLPRFTGDIEVLTNASFFIPSPSPLLLILGFIPGMIYITKRKYRAP